MKLLFAQPVHWLQVDGERSRHRFQKSYNPPVTDVDLSSYRGVFKDSESVVIRARGAHRFTRKLKHPWLPGTVAHVNLRRSGLWGASPLPTKVALVLTVFGAVVGGMVVLSAVESRL